MGRPRLKNPDGLTTVIATEESGEMGKRESVKRLLQGPRGPLCSGHTVPTPTTDGFSGGPKVATYSVTEPLSHPVGDLGPFW